MSPPFPSYVEGSGIFYPAIFVSALFRLHNSRFIAMLVLIAIAFLLKRYGTQAVPLPIPTSSSSASEVAIFAREGHSDGCHGRTVWNILWSCLATTFACTWVSVHPNVPWRNDGKWSLLGRRIFLMFFSILAPEFMIMWAFKQWRGAVMIKEVVNEAIMKVSPDPQNPIIRKWTTTHGHLLQMGGFRLCVTQRENLFCEGKGPVLRSRLIFKKEHGETRVRISLDRERDLIPKQFHYRHETSEGSWSIDYKQHYEITENIWEGVLTIDALKKLLSENLIRFPTITEGEISDRSKGDALSKGIALLQLTWFIVQIITRYAQGLAITELELTTAALAGLNSVMYIFWWNKPHDVRFPVVVQSRGVEQLLAKRTEDISWSFLDEEFDFRKHLWMSVSSSIEGTFHTLRSFFVSSPDMIKNVLFKLFSAIRALPRRLYYHLSKSYPYLVRTVGGLKGGGNVEPEHTSDKEGNYVPEVIDLEPPAKAHSVSSHSSKKDMSRMQRIKIALISGTRTTAICFAIIYSLPAYVVNYGLCIPIAQILQYYAKGDGILPMVFDAEEQTMMFSMMFYSEDAGVRPLLSSSSIAGALFGALHCLAWNFSFPSHVEKIIWRTASLGVAGTCFITFAFVIMWDAFLSAINGLYERWATATCAPVMFFVPLIYPVARVSLLVLAVTSLRSLPPSAFDTIDWIELVPHI